MNKDIKVNAFSGLHMNTKIIINLLLPQYQKLINNGKQILNDFKTEKKNMMKSEPYFQIKLRKTNELFAKILKSPKSFDMFYLVNMQTEHNVLALIPLEMPKILRRAIGEFIH